LCGGAIFYATTIEGMAERAGLSDVAIVTDFNRKQPLRALICFFEAFRLVLRVKPHVVLSTGAAPGFFVLLIGKLSGAKTIWIDSAANAERLSMSGRLAGAFADLWLTQWEHLSTPSGPHYVGAVL
jgi:UDP-N-acetylglucosamine:LPS N-acetylglucosamine transferase